MRRIAIAVALLVSLAGPAWAGFDEGLAAHERGDYVTALREWEPLAEQGIAEAQHNLGIMYANGQGVPQDYADAIRWFHLAAEQSFAGSQFRLGLMYENGWGVPQDYAEAVRWYRLAAEQGNAKAQFSLGVMYVLGHGVPQNYALAHMWLNLAAAQGSDDGQKYRELVAEKMTPAKIAEAQKLAREWKPKKE